MTKETKRQYKLSEEQVAQIRSDCGTYVTKHWHQNSITIYSNVAIGGDFYDDSLMGKELCRRYGIYGIDLEDLCDGKEAKFTADFPKAYVYNIEYRDSRLKRTEMFHLYEFYEDFYDEDGELDRTETLGYAIIGDSTPFYLSEANLYYKC